MYSKARKKANSSKEKLETMFPTSLPSVRLSPAVTKLLSPLRFTGCDSALLRPSHQWRQPPSSPLAASEDAVDALHDVVVGAADSGDDRRQHLRDAFHRGVDRTQHPLVHEVVDHLVHVLEERGDASLPALAVGLVRNRQRDDLEQGIHRRDDEQTERVTSDDRQHRSRRQREVPCPGEHAERVAADVETRPDAEQDDQRFAAVMLGELATDQVGRRRNEHRTGQSQPVSPASVRVRQTDEVGEVEDHAGEQDIADLSEERLELRLVIEGRFLRALEALFVELLQVRRSLLVRLIERSTRRRLVVEEEPQTRVEERQESQTPRRRREDPSDDTAQPVEPAEMRQVEVEGAETEGNRRQKADDGVAAAVLDDVDDAQVGGNQRQCGEPVRQPDVPLEHAAQDEGADGQTDGDHDVDRVVEEQTQVVLVAAVGVLHDGLEQFTELLEPFVEEEQDDREDQRSVDQENACADGDLCEQRAAQQDGAVVADDGRPDEGQTVHLGLVQRVVQRLEEQPSDDDAGEAADDPTVAENHAEHTSADGGIREQCLTELGRQIADVAARKRADHIRSAEKEGGEPLALGLAGLRCALDVFPDRGGAGQAAQHANHRTENVLGERLGDVLERVTDNVGDAVGDGPDEPAHEAGGDQRGRNPSVPSDAHVVADEVHGGDECHDRERETQRIRDHTGEDAVVRAFARLASDEDEERDPVERVHDHFPREFVHGFPF